MEKNHRPNYLKNKLPIFLFSLVLAVFLFSILVYAMPLISFNSPTLVNNAYTRNTSIEINISISESSLGSLIYNWNGTNFTIYNSSLMLMYNFENISSLGENSTYVADFSQYSRNGTITGATLNPAGKYGKAYSFAGSNKIVTNGSFLDGTVAFTYSAWVYTSSLASNSYAGIISKYIGDSDCTNLQVHSDGTIYVDVNKPADGSSYGQSAAGTLTNNNWYHLLMAYNGAGATNADKIKLYVNGVEKSLTFTGTISSAAPVNSAPLAIGSMGTLAFFTGIIDEPRIWGRTLSPREAYQQYASNLNKFNSTRWYLSVNQSKNSTKGLSDGLYTYQTFVANSSGSLNSTDLRNVTVQAAQILLDWIYPTGNINIIQNQFFNISVNVSCINNDCGNVNVTLDPTTGISYNFTTCGITGRIGPTQNNCITNYTGTTLENLVNVSSGIQTWIVPITGTYKIEAYGAASGSGVYSNTAYTGKGAYMSGQFYLVAGDIIKVAVGQRGGNSISGSSYSGAGGGGGSFVAYANNTPLLIAGGGGGSGAWASWASGAAQYGQNATIINNGSASYRGGIPATNGSGGNTTFIHQYSASGGGGFYSNGRNGSSLNDGGSGGNSYLNNLTGGLRASGFTNEASDGGFGGGAGGSPIAGGGGGGYSGGFGSNCTGTPQADGGGGGGSYNAGLIQNNSVGLGISQGKVSFTLLTSGKSGTVSMNSTSVPFYTNVTNPYNLSLNQGQSQIITWWVNATGTINTPYPFFVYANITSNLSVGGNQTSNWNITILDITYPIINITYPLNITYGVNVNSINYTYYDYVGGGSCWWSNNSGIWNSSIVLAGNNFTNLTSLDGNNTWTVYCNDSSGNMNYTTVNFKKSIPQLGISLINPLGNINVTQNQNFQVSVNISCLVGNCSSINVTLDPALSSYNFTTCGATGSNGPNQTQCNANYTGTTLAGRVNVTRGYQRWVVPTSGRYRVEANGAGGGLVSCSGYSRGYGAKLIGEFDFLAGDVLFIVVGQLGSDKICTDWGGSGGGFSAVVKNVTSSSYQMVAVYPGAYVTPLVVAGGAGGTGDDGGNNGNTNATSFIPGNGSGGLAGSNSGGGAGFVGNGAAGTCGGIGALSFLNGSNGSACYSGGFGGGGAPYSAGGGGGGFTGGNGSDQTIYSGFGGTSYNSGINQINTSAANSRAGYVTITSLNEKGGTVSMNISATPFYTTTQNPYNLTLNQGQSQIITWDVSATGSFGSTYNFFVYANLTSDLSIGNQTNSWNVTITNGTVVDMTYPLFYNYSDNNAQLYTSGTGWFNVTVLNTNGTVWLEINNINITARNITANIYNASYAFTTNGTYAYRWHSYGNSTNLNYNVSNTRYYVVNGPSIISNLNFILPTPANETTTSNRSVIINMSINSNGPITNLLFNWNGINYSFFDNSLMLMYNLDNNSAIGENSTKVVDVSTYSNNGTVIGAVWNSSGKYNGAYQFNGVNQYINTSYLQRNVTNYTIGVWIKTNSSQGVIVNDRGSGSGNSLTLAIGPSCGISRGSYCLNSAAGIPAFGLDSEGVWRGTNGEIKVSDNNWHYIVGVFSSNSSQIVMAANFKVYVDGKLSTGLAGDQVGTVRSPLTGLSGTRIGYHQPWARYFNGSIDEVRIWNRSLTAAEIYEQYVSNLQKFNSTQWYLQVNQSKNSTGGLDDGAYTYQIFAPNSTINSSEKRYINIQNSLYSTNFVNPTETSGSYINKSSIIINVSSNGTSLLNITIYLYNSSNNLIRQNQTNNSKFLITYLNLSEGTYYFNSSSNFTNEFANTGTLNVTIDTTHPQISYGINTAINYANLSQNFIFVNISLNESNIGNLTYTLANSSGVVNQTSYTTSTNNLTWTDIIDGTYSYYVNITDLAGNKNSTQKYSITLDTHSPNGTLMTPANATWANNTLMTFTLNVSDNLASRNATIYIYNQTILYNQTTIGLGGVTQATIGVVVTVVEGVYTWFWQIFDNIGNQFTTINNSLYVDTVVPYFVNITYPPNNTMTSLANPVISFNISDSLSEILSYRIYVDEAIVSTNGTNVTLSRAITTVKILTKLALGNHTIKVESFDRVNNTANSTSITLQIVPPIVYLNSPVDNQFFNNQNINFTFNITDPGYSTLNCTLTINGIVNNTNSAVPRTVNLIWPVNGIAESRNISAIILCKNAENSNTTDEATFGIDLASPTIVYGSNNYPNGKITYNNNLTINITSNDLGSGVSNLTIYLFNSTNYLINSTFISSNNIQFTFNNLPDGIYFYNATSLDYVNWKNSTQTYNVTINAIAPNITINSPQNIYINNLSILLNFSSSGRSTWWNNESSNISYNGAINYLFSEGNHTIFVYSNNSAGLIKIVNFSFIIDTIKPTIIFDFPTLSNGTTASSNSIGVKAISEDLNSILNTTIYLYNSSGKVYHFTNVSSSLAQVNINSLSDGNYWFNASSCDLAGNCEFTETRQITISANPSLLSLELLSPLENIDAIQNQLFNVTARVDCYYNDCGNINVTLDPVSNSQISYIVNLNNNSHCYPKVKQSWDWERGACGGTGWSTNTAHTDNSLESYLNCSWTDGLPEGTTITNISIVPVNTSQYNGGSTADWYLNNLRLLDNDNMGNIGTGCGRALSYPLPFSTVNISAYNLGKINSLIIAKESGSWYIFSDNGYFNVTVSYTTGKSGTVSMNSSATPFYTNVTNPYNLTLAAGESQIITWWVNATGTVNTPYEFFVYANKTSNRSIYSQTSRWNVTIIDIIAPIININYPLNTTYSTNVVALNYTFSDYNSGGSCWYSNSSGELNLTVVAAGINFTNVTSLDGSNTWTLYCNDSSGNLNSTSITFTKRIPQLGLSVIYPTGNINSNKGTWFNVTVNVSCSNGNCGLINVSLDPIPTADYVLQNLSLTTSGPNGWSGYIMGYKFSPQINTSVSELCKYVGRNATVKIYNESYYELANITINNNSASWKCQQLANSVPIYTGKSYFVVVCGGDYYQVLPSAPMAIRNVTISNGVYQYSSTCRLTGVNSGNQYIYGLADIGIGAPSSAKGGLISMSSSATPFYTNVTNPYNLTLNEGESQIITWWVNTTGSINNTYNFFVYANLTSNPEVGNVSGSWNVTITNGTVVDNAYPLFFNYSDNNNSITPSGIALFSVNINNTNGTVWFVINNTNYSAANLSLNRYNINISGLTNKTYNYTWRAYGNGSSNLLSTSISRYYTVRTADTTPPQINIQSPLNATYRIIDLAFNISINENASWCGFSLDNIANITMTLNSSNTGANFINSTMSQGSHTIIFSCNDTSGNINYSSKTFFIDTISPFIAFSSPANTTYTTKTSSITLINNSDAKNIWFNRGLGNETYTSSVSKSLSEGTNIIYAYANDSVGNLNSTSITLFVDSIAPSINVNLPIEQTYTTSIIGFNISTNENATCLFALNSTNNYTLQTNNNRNFNYSLILESNTYYVTYYCNDSLNNLATKNIIFGVDVVPPQITLNYPASNKYYNNANVQFNYTPLASDGLDTCELWGNWSGAWHRNQSSNALVNDSNNYFNLTLADGTYIWNVWCNNTISMEDWSSQGNVTFTIDRTPPHVYFVFPLNISYNISIVNLEIANNSDTKNIWWNNGTYNASYTSGLDLQLSDGTYDYIVYANDSAGNLNQTNVSFYVDTSHTQFSDFISNNASLIGTGLGLFNVTLANTNTTVELVINGTNIMGVSISAGIYSANYTLSSEGVYSYYWQSYSNGTSHLYSRSEVNYYTVNNTDKISPEAILISPEDNSYNNISAINFTANLSDETIQIGDTQSGIKNVTLNIYNSSDNLVNQTIVTGYVEGTLTSTVGVVVTLVDGVYNWFYSLFDFAGNIFTTSNSTFTLDNTVPSINIISPYNGLNSTSGEININYQVSDANLDSCWYDDEGYSANNLIDNCANITGFNWQDGQHNLVIYANDSAGNTNFVSVRFLIDSVSPEVTLISPGANNLVNSNYTTNITFECSATDNINLKNISLYITNSSNSNLVLNRTANISGTSNSSSWTLDLLYGNYSWNCFASDGLGNSKSAISSGSLILNFTDTDGDNLADLTDTLQGNESFVNTTGISNLNISVGGNSAKGSFDDVREIIFSDSISKLINFTFNFTESKLDLGKIIIILEDNSIIVNLSGQLQAQYNKTIYLRDNKFIELCVRDAEISNISEISSDCTAELGGETNFTDCLGNNTGVTRNGLTCVDEGDIIKVENLRYSAIRGIPEVITPQAISRGGGSSNKITSNVSVNDTSLENKINGGCTNNENCQANQYCFQNKCYAGECTDNSQCSDEKSCWNYRCVKLFDIKILEIGPDKDSDNFISFSYLLKAMADISNDVVVDFWLERNGAMVSSGKDTIYIGNMEEKIEKSKIFIPSELEPGAYNFYVRVTYGQYSAESHRQIEINKEGKMSSSIKSALFYIIPLLILIIILLLIIVIKIEKKKLKNFFIYEEEWILTHKLAICLLYLSLVSMGLIFILGYLRIISLPIPGDYLLNTRLFIEFVIIPYLYLILAVTISIIVLSLVVKHKKQAHRQIYGEKYRPKRKNRLERILKHIKSKIINNKIREDVILLGKKGYDVDLIGKENMQKRLADWKKKGYNTESIGLKKENMQKRLADWKKKGYDVSSLER